MALSTTVADQYFRQAGQQQVLFAYWLSAGDVERARLAMNVANWYYQQLGLPYYLPTNLAGYVPNPTTPDAAATIAASLPLNVTLAAPPAGSGFAPRDTAAGTYCSAFPDDPVCQGGGIAFTADNGYCDIFPDDPICSGNYYGGYGGGGSLPAPVYIDQPVNITINQEGLTLGDVASRISGALASAAAAIAGAVDAALAAAIGGIQHALNALGNELLNIYKLLSRLAGYILQFLKGLLLDVIHGIVAALQAIGKLLKDVMTNVIMPALQALQKLRNYLIQIYERYLRPLLVILQDVRKVLAILKVFHIGFANKLDAALADVQRKISAPLLYLLQYTNAVANYINLILDARLLLQRPLFLASLAANKGSAANVLINGMNTPPDPVALAALRSTPAIPTPAQSQAALNDFLTSGSGTMAGSIAQYSAGLQASLCQNV